MSQRFFKKDGLTVMMGYDRPLNYVFCIVERGDEILYSNLDDDSAGTQQQNVEYYRPVLASLGIEVPESMYQGVMLDQRTRSGNLVVDHPIALTAFLKLFCDSGEPHVPQEFPNARPGLIYCGSTLRLNVYHEIDAEALGLFLPEGFEDVEAWASYPYRVVWKNDPLRAIVCYCEGDVTITVDDSAESYATRMRAATMFYCSARLQSLTCCVCGESSGTWLQHWNRDFGFGVCYACITRIRERQSGPDVMSKQEIESNYGIEGVNWGRS